MDMYLRKMYGLDSETLTSAAEDAKDYAISRGIAMHPSDLTRDARVPLPLCLFPSPFPENWFTFVYELQPHLNLVLHKIAHSRIFLKECLSSIIEADEFIRKIFEIFEAVDYGRKKKQWSLGVIRSDYLLNSNPSGGVLGIKQVENNTIASGFGGIAPLMRDLHRFVLKKFGQQGFEHKLPLNEATSEISKGIFAAWKIYGNPNAVVLFVVEENTFNICDQRILEYGIFKYGNKTKVIRCTFKELRTCAKLKGDALIVKGKEVAVVYYRVGYAPEHYEPEDWGTRLLIECSNAIKCPSAGLHLAGTKRVQLYLTQDGILEKFVSHDVAVKIREVFAQQYSLDVAEGGDDAIVLGLGNPERFVLKPEREGGGNNIYGDDLKNHLKQIRTSCQRNAYILMELINPPSSPNCLVVRDRTAEVSNVVSELGIFGVILGNEDNVSLNISAGHLLRTKKVELNEGGIAAGFGAMGSPILETDY